MAGREQRHRSWEGVHAGIVRREGVVGGQHDAEIGVRGRKCDRALVVGVDISKRVQGFDREVKIWQVPGGDKKMGNRF
jgi:hypothetical protein